jgi:hypothetical protein
MTTPPELRGRRVRFRIGDIHVPSSDEVLAELYSERVLQGEVIDLTTSVTDERVFAVVKVDRVSRVLIVPVDRVSCVT